MQPAPRPIHAPLRRLQLVPPLEHPSVDGILPRELSLHIHRDMVRARALEERTIKMAKSGEGLFWVGGPGEEAFQTCLGLQVRRGNGPTFDYLHLHYRALALMLTMGMPMVEHTRQMAMRLTDTHTMGRNFVGHYSKPEWNVAPVKSVIGSQFVMAIGTALVQKRLGGDAISIVQGGEAGTAQGDFASCMVWGTRPGQELPILMIVTHNGYGISTPANTQHGEASVIDRGRAFGIPGEVVDGNDPTSSWFAIERGMNYCRRERRPYLIEAHVSRLYGHTSSSGSQRVEGEVDCLTRFEEQLTQQNWLDEPMREGLYREVDLEVQAAVSDALRDPMPSLDDVARHTYVSSNFDLIYPGDYTGLPGQS